MADTSVKLHLTHRGAHFNPAGAAWVTELREEWVELWVSHKERCSVTASPSTHWEPLTGSCTNHSELYITSPLTAHKGKRAVFTVHVTSAQLRQTDNRGEPAYFRCSPSHLSRLCRLFIGLCVNPVMNRHFQSSQLPVSGSGLIFCVRFHQRKRCNDSAL